MTAPKTPKDKKSLELNPTTGELDLVKSFNTDRILMAENNAAGNKRMIYDPMAPGFIEDGPVEITDSNGNIITV